jgi:hypothetical protein
LPPVVVRRRGRSRHEVLAGLPCRLAVVPTVDGTFGEVVGALGGHVLRRAGDHSTHELRGVDHVVHQVVNGELLARRLHLTVLGCEAGDEAVHDADGFVEGAVEFHVGSW